MIESYIDQPMRAAAARFGGANLTEAVVESICNAARLHLGRPVSLVAEHGDLWIANLLLSRSTIGIVDWEHFVPETLPGFDMLFFCVTYAVHFPWVPFGWERAEIAFARAFLHRTWMNAYIGRFLDRACASAELPREIVPILLPVMLARMALRQSQRSIAGTSGERSWLNMLQSWLTRTSDNWLDQWAKTR
jgi:hypothetical protein